MTIARLWQQDDQLNLETLGQLPFNAVALLATGNLGA
jgi:hypothetical protein